MKLSIFSVLFICLPTLIDTRGLPEPSVKNLRARYDHKSKSIYVEWDYDEQTNNIQFIARYRITSRVSPDNTWKLSRTSDTSVRLHLPDIRNGDEVEVQIKIEANNFMLGHLVPGEKYEMTIRSATSPDHVSNTAAIVEISMPREEEYFEVGNLVISSKFRSDGRGVVNLTWEVPPEVQQKIVEYDVKYAAIGSTEWQQIKFAGETPSASLHDLKSDTEYVLKIKTKLRNNLETESGEFRFKTPKVAVNPISKVDVIYSSEMNGVRLQWILEPHVPQDKIVGYDVFLTDNKDEPESRWRYIRLDGKEAALTLPDLKRSTTYYVRVNVRNRDGTVIQAPSIYRFTTIDQYPGRMEYRMPNSLAYRNIAPGQVNISWAYPHSISGRVTGSTVMYTDDERKKYDQWQKINIVGGEQKSVTLTGLRSGTRYFVQIIPRLENDQFDYSSIEKFELRTDAPENLRNLDNPYFNQIRDYSRATFQEMREPSNTSEKRMAISACNPDAIKNGCAWDEKCVPRIDNPEEGWCISDALRNAIISSDQ